MCERRPTFRGLPLIGSRGASCWRGVLFALAALSMGSRTEAQQLTVETVPIPLGVTDTDIVARLRQRGPVFPLADGWEIRPGSTDSVTPHVRVRTRNGVIWKVILIWGPPNAPDADALLGFVIEGLPRGAECVLRSGGAPLEGGTTRGLSWRCGRYSGEVGTGVWPKGRTATVAIALE
jgi:hypothetical protein